LKCSQSRPVPKNAATIIGFREGGAASLAAQVFRAFSRISIDALKKRKEKRKRKSLPALLPNPNGRFNCQ
jgi:hypothetical protein